jgi:4-diphosphocytidyl-2C-methyl-D-erythritol kinase
MQSHIDDTHRNLGQLAAMAQQTEAAERKILARATERLDEVQSELRKGAEDALTGGGDKYMALVQERGQLQQVIAQARQVLGASGAR